MRKYINKIAEFYYRKFDLAFLKRFHPYYDDYSREEDYDILFDGIIKRTESKRTEPSLWKRDRFYNLYSALDLVKDIDGDIAECGTYKGVSSFLICSKLKKYNPEFTGKGVTLIDSFEGLSAPTKEDKLPQELTGLFTATVENLKEVLKDFPDVTIYKGWVPEVLKTIEERKYKFVHVDVDLVEPTVGAMEYFMPRMVEGGVLVCDDYASNGWPGTKPGVDKFIEKNNLKALRLSSSQIIIIK
ncbi:MAG: TylF/MycF/NovP-related O-methyltransferase [Candidatus Paceibacterota bacterium]|jgi:hypothetical protein